MPRCRSDERDNCVHLTKYEDIILVANKYFVRNENPIVLEIDISEFEDKIVWADPTMEKPWHQPNAAIQNILWKNILAYAHLEPASDTSAEFVLAQFHKLDK